MKVKMRRWTEYLLSNPRAQAALICFVLIAFVCGPRWSVGSATAQLPPRVLARDGLRQSSQPPRLDRQISKDLVAGKNPTPEESQGSGPPPQFNEQEQRLVPRGIARRDALIRVFRQLNLTPDQKAKLQDLTRQVGNQIPVLNRLRQAQNEALEEAIYGLSFDPQLVERRAAELAATQAEQIKVQARVLSEIRQVLTPEQAIKFRELLEQERRRPAEGPPRLQAPPDQP